jgi:hypothetical protein
MKTNNIVLLGLIGVAIYFIYKNKSKIYPTAPNPTDKNSMPQGIIPTNETGVPKNVNTNTGVGIEQTLDAAGKPIEVAYGVRYAIKGIPNII